MPLDGGFCGSLEEIEGLCGFGGDGVWSFFEVVGDFDDGRSGDRERGNVFGYVLPVDDAGAGPEVVVFGAVIVMEVNLGDAGLEDLECLVDAYVFFGVRQVCVAYVEAYAYAVEVAGTEDFENVFGSGDFVLEIFNEDANAEGMGEGLEMLDGSEGVFEGAGVPGIVFLTEVKDAGVDGDLLGGFEGALDLVHGGDALGFFGVDEINVWGDVARPLAAAAVGKVDGLVEGGGYACVSEPGGDVADGGAVAVVEVMAGGKELDGLCAGLVEGIEQAGVQALLEEDVGGDGGSHHF
jgi:hypothetical protein